jgi:hypothetical protein
MKIHIFYRHYDIGGTDHRGRPSWFDFEKLFYKPIGNYY